jgi:hypothetical protein
MFPRGRYAIAATGEQLRSNCLRLALGRNCPLPAARLGFRRSTGGIHAALTAWTVGPDA